MQRMSAREFRRRQRKRRSKYGNRKVTLDGHTFDSQMEARYYQQLIWLKQAKQIKDFKLQPCYRLLDGFEKDGTRHRPIDYIADFEILHHDDSVEVVDVKGAVTQAFGLKRKMFEKRYPHKLSVVTFDKVHGWIELDKLKKLKRG